MNRVAFWVGTLVICAAVYATFLHGVIDEILTLVAFCGRDCGYPYPIGPALNFYRAEEVADAIIDLSVLGMIISAVKLALEIRHYD